MADPNAPAPTPQQRLDSVRAAMLSVMSGGQRVRYKDREVTYADLEQLREIEKALVLEVSSLARPRFVRFRAIG